VTIAEMNRLWADRRLAAIKLLVDVILEDCYVDELKGNTPNGGQTTIVISEYARNPETRPPHHERLERASAMIAELAAEAEKASKR
jgi:hypothetical protein